MGLTTTYAAGQTPLDEDEKDGLKIKSITTQAELDQFEQLNIEKAIQWSIETRFKPSDILTEQFIRKVHKQMFSDVWTWAGEFRKSQKNIGADWINIAADLKCLLDDTNYWIEHETYPSTEICIRFKHRLVSIHCFPNGNGRHSRIMADILSVVIFSEAVFTWHKTNLIAANSIRKKYIKALREADKGNIQLLVDFARS